MPLSATDAVSPAMEHAKKLLFQPFRFGLWARLAIVGFLTGEISSSGSCGSPPTSFPSGRGSQNPPEVEAVLHKLAVFWHAHAALIATVITAGIVIFFLLGILFTYLNSRMRFVLFDTIIEKECRMVEYWSRRREVAWRFFIWQLLFGFGSLMVFVILFGIPACIAWAAGWLNKPGDHVLPLLLGGILVFFAFAVLSICVNLVRVFTKDFVVPYMAVEGLTVMEGWRRLLAAMKAEKGGYAGYVGMKIVLSIAAGIIFAIIGGIFLLIIALPFFFGGIMIGAMAAGAGVTWNAFTITLTIVLGSIGIFVFKYVIAFISVPVTVFFPAYSIHFLASRYPKLDAVLHPAPPSPVIPPQAPPPFLPPEPNALGS